MKKTCLITTLVMITLCSFGQSQITTTGNNVINTANPYVADIVIGSNAAGGTRHDASIMWWSNASASRIYNTADVFYLSIWNTTTPNVALAAGVGSSSYFRGNVGVGTTSPNSTLEVNGTTRLGGIDYGSTTVLSVAPGTIGFDAPGIPGGRFYVSGTTGNVGIGTGTPDAKLAVNGTIHTQEIKVDLTGWPDYVFKPTYHLPTLEEIKNYINQNDHLPGLPSAQEVAKDGINLGEMNKLLTKKVEEMTLYLIEQNKEITDQKSTLQSLQKSIIDQQTRLKSLEQLVNKLTSLSNQK